MRKIVALTMLVMATLLVYAQSRVITGRVVDEKGEPVSGASILIKGTTTGASANANGDFRISAKSGDVLEITATNFGRQEVTVNANQTSVAVRLTRAGTMMDEVVITSLGVQRQARELGYSTAKVKSGELTQAKVVNLQNGLTGKVSGLNIQTVNNGVFADTRITLRGIRSLTGNNQPMLIVDGVPISLGFISSINPNDIQDVSILKSSSATAVYGPDGVNGAIVISTKKGSRGRPNVTLSHTVQIESVSLMPKFQTQFGSGSSVDAFGFGEYDPVENQGYGPAFDGSLKQIGRDAPDGSKYLVEYIARPDEKRKFWNRGVTNQTDVSFSTGDFYLSAQNVDIQGILPKDKNKRTSFHMMSSREYNNFKATFNVTYTQNNWDINAGSAFGNGRDYTPYWNLINTPMQIPITRFKNWDGAFSDYGQNSNYWATPNGFYNDYYHNPYFMIDQFRQNGRSDDIFGNIELNYKAASWLNFTYRLGATVSNTTGKSIQKPYTYSAFAKASGKSNAGTGDLVGAVQDASSYNSRLNSELFATIKKDISDKFSFDALIGTSYRHIKSQSMNISSSNLGIPGVYNISVRKGDPVVGQSDAVTKLGRAFGKFSFGYDRWAFAEFTGSYDIDSRLGNPYNYDRSNISFFYPGVSVSAVLSDAIPAIKSSNTISFLKVRGAVTKTGNVSALGAYSLENTYSQASGFPYGTLLGFTSNNTLRRDKYDPEFVLNKEVGIEVGLLKNRINIEATAYTQDNTDQLITVNYSAATGYPSALLNAASFTNRGIELDLKLTPLVKMKNGSVDLKFNYTYTTNEVTKLIEGVSELGIGNGNYIIVGRPAYTFKLTDYVKDDQGRVIVDKKTGYPSIDPTIKEFGSTLPKHIFGVSLNANWKAFSLSAVADYRGGNMIYSGIGPDMDFSGISYRSGQNGRMPFVFPNSVYEDVPGSGKYVPNTSVYTQSGGYNFWSQSINTAVNSNYLASGAFWKLREVAITYTLPGAAYAWAGNAVKGATFSLTGRNLVTWLPKTNQWTDPEFSNTTGNAQGVNDRNNTPPTRIFGANLTLNF